ncbi:hypothetical protein OJAV_G00067200 [Oryzias javanicus]|uniref:Periphilin-1 C-terminal domain-containing protein n=1 Tax=Oryzias javanicus TaxID=123683 RepID=A0A3S2N024_ORYJA|nr:hypothetical protein OJAV_G00067200 [Oryzias javanicus]
MDYPRAQDMQDNEVNPKQDEQRAFRRVRSPSRPRAWHLPSIYKPRIGRGFYKPHFSRDDHSFYKGGHKYHYFKPRNSPTRPSSTPRPVLPRATSSRDKDVQFTVSLSDRHQSSERDHRASKSKDGEWSRDMELPLTASQTAARDRAIQLKRREIDEVYYQECEIFSLVVKMLIAKDPSLEGPIQSSLQENLRDIGKRCVVAMKKFIEDYDSRDLLN